MTKTRRGTALAVTAAIFAADVPLAAQEASDGKSLTNTVTNGLFFSDRDNYLSTTGIWTLKNNVIFGQIKAPGESAASFDAGTGLFLGDFWLGLALAQKADIDKSESTDIDQTYDASETNTLLAGKTTTDTWYNTNSQYYKFAALFGNKTWGVKNTFIFNPYTVEDDSNGFTTDGSSVTELLGTGTAQTSSRVTEKYATNYSSWSDSLEFGINLPKRIAVKAWAKAGHSAGGSYDNQTVASYEQDSASSAPSWDGKAGILSASKNTNTYGASFLSIEPGVFGSILIDLNDKFTLNPTLTYNLSLPLYSNDYFDGSGNLSTVSGTAISSKKVEYAYQGINSANGSDITSTTTTSSSSISEISSMTHTVSPAVKISAKISERVVFAARYTPTVSISNRETVTTAETTTAETTAKESFRNGTDSGSWDETTTTTNPVATVARDSMSFTNTIDFGSQIHIIPQKLRLNLGGRMINTVGTWTTLKTTKKGLSVTTTTGEFLDGDARTPTTTVNSVSIDNQGQEWTSNGGFSAVYTTGLTWFVDEMVDLDLSLTNGADIWAPSNWTLQLNIRY